MAHQKSTQNKLQNEQKMLRRLLKSQRHEMQLVAYEIHDGLAQLLTSMASQLQMFDYFRKNKPEEAEKTYQTARRILDQAIDETRRLMQGLRPRALEEQGLETAIKTLIAEHEENSHIDVEFVCSIHSQQLESSLENALYRIAQEAINNAIRYSKTEKIRVSLQYDDGQIKLDIRDWGRGFNTDAVGSGHFGLEGIRQRAVILGGEAAIQSTPGEGTQISVEIPLENLSRQP